MHLKQVKITQQLQIIISLMNNLKNHSARNLHVQCSPSHGLRSHNPYLTPTSDILKQKSQNQTNVFVRQNSQPKLFKKTQLNNNSNRKRSSQKYYKLSVKKTKRQDSRQSNCQDISNYRINEIMAGLEEVQANFGQGSIKYSELLRLFYLLKYIKYSRQEEYKTQLEREQLKKVYQVWISLSKNGICKIVNIIMFIYILEDLPFNTFDVKEKLLSIASKSLKTLQIQGKIKQNKIIQQNKDNPQLIFFVKRKNYLFNENGIANLESQKDNIIKTYQLFLSSKANFKQNPKKRERIYSTQQNIISKESKITNRLQTFTFENNESQLEQISDNYDKNLKPLSLFRQKKQNIIFDLDTLSRPKSKSRNKRSDEVQYERSTQQFTFHPIIKPYKVDHPQKQNLIKKIKDVDKVMYRMKEARTLKQEKQILVKSGWTNNSNLSKLEKNIVNVKISKKSKTNAKQKVALFKHNLEKQNSDEIKNIANGDKTVNIMLNGFGELTQISQKNNPSAASPQKKKQVNKTQEFKIPILYIDVNIQQGKKQRIIIYQGDKANQLSQNFGKRHKLDQQTICRLEEMLKQQINSVLSRIDEQLEQESFILC